MRFLIIKAFLFLLLFAFSNQDNSAQEISILRSGLGVSGSSNSVSLQNRNYYLRQSIGQNGIVGTLTLQHKTLIQGFLQPTLSKANTSESNNLEVVIETIPLTGSYKIIFPEGEKTDVNIALFTMLGQKVYSQKIDQCREFEINLDRYHVGCYVVFIESNREQYTAKLLKLN